MNVAKCLRLLMTAVVVLGFNQAHANELTLDTVNSFMRSSDTQFRVMVKFKDASSSRLSNGSGLSSSSGLVYKTKN